MTDLRLFRIDTSKPSQPIPPSSDINSILITSDWEIQYGADSDWQEVLTFGRLHQRILRAIFFLQVSDFLERRLMPKA
jgi:hypothetical protein